MVAGAGGAGGIEWDANVGAQWVPQRRTKRNWRGKVALRIEAQHDATLSVWQSQKRQQTLLSACENPRKKKKMNEQQG